ncbi:paraquat-inducible protein A [Dickeya fangzhongdai]|uniref:paraquat-inducible protein A n=1 Tax=Dickeya fangzhongdai TaxID=1778540 RepID=UPI0004F7ADEE|nr:paraquat-inducible protein A [Dickeya fangzhongdai]AIR67929.1 paraquat-inducible protein A [Dickeya fangzhongdai]KGT98036.1 paraquat-inducible protein A [Dickeya fangzhongdai]WES88197.1 paraquat-inducible protein A [Dickeya fangzhongdai]WPD76058.1 paraquat-inducible protein A [Dickeya fangzhongdai]
MHKAPSARQMNVCDCPVCGLVCDAPAPNDSAARCPRCHTRLDAHSPGSTALSWALLLAALILYIPANTLPVMYTSLLASGGESTIMTGVIDFWQHGSYGIALIIFIASVVIPCMKFLSLMILLVTARRKSVWARRERTRLYRITEWIGRWSMLDVIVVAVVCSLVRFHTLGEAEPRPGILFFGLVVILTMLSAMSFDPRSIWEDEQ